MRRKHMNKESKIYKSILFYTVLFALLLLIVHIILNRSGVILRRIPLYICTGVIGAGTVAGLFQIVLKTSKKSSRIILSALLIVLSLCVAYFGGLKVSFPTSGYTEHIVEKDGEKYVATVYGHLHTYVHYHDYINYVVCGKQVRISEDYGKGSFDPLTDGNNHPVLRRTAYDKEGNEIQSENSAADESYVIPCQYVKAFLLKPSPNEEYPQVVSIGSAGELSEYITENEEIYDLSEFKSATAKYDNDYFNKMSLVLILTKESSGSTYYQSVSINRKDKEVAILRATPVPFTEDLAYWHIIAEVEKDEPILTNSDDYNIWFTE